MKPNSLFIKSLFLGLLTCTTLSCHASLTDLSTEVALPSHSHTTAPFKLGTFNPAEEIETLKRFVTKETLRDTDIPTKLFFIKSATQIPFQRTLDLLIPLFSGPEKTRQKSIGHLTARGLLTLEETLTKTLGIFYEFLDIALIDERERLQRERFGLDDKDASRIAQGTYRDVTDAFLRLSDAYVTILKAHYPRGTFDSFYGLLPQKASSSRPLFYLRENEHYLLTNASTVDGPFINYHLCHTTERNPCESTVLLQNGRPVKEDGVYLIYSPSYVQSGYGCPWRMFGYHGADSPTPFTLAPTTQNVTDNFFDDDRLIGLSHVPVATIKLLRTLFAQNEPEKLKRLTTNVKDFVALPTTEEDLALFELLCLEDALSDMGELLPLASISKLPTVETTTLTLENLCHSIESQTPRLTLSLDGALPLLPLEAPSSLAQEKAIITTPIEPREDVPTTPTQAFVNAVETSYEKPVQVVMQEKETILLEEIKRRLSAQEGTSSSASSSQGRKTTHNKYPHKSAAKKRGGGNPAPSAKVATRESIEVRARKELAEMKLQGRIKWQRVLGCINQIRRDIPELHAHVIVTGSHSVLHFPNEQSLTIAPKHGKQDTTLPAGVVRSFCFELIKRGLGLHDRD
ncbi:MAG: hypothetical protein H2057_03090 [Alphaproteobacteria bacterium]|nr:hypothetical protein [Alphaproteobacteria bacterium]